MFQKHQLFTKPTVRKLYTDVPCNNQTIMVIRVILHILMLPRMNFSDLSTQIEVNPESTT